MTDQIDRARDIILDVLRKAGGRVESRDLNATGLPRRTRYRVLKDLENEGVLVQKRSLADTRGWVYFLREKSGAPA